MTIAFAVVVLAGFAESRQKQTFDEIDVHRINVVEPDGTLRMVISNKADFPGIIIKGKETPHPDRATAGMLFFNDEGTENGGLIFGGSKDKQGKVTSYGHLSFDQYEQDQVFSIDAGEENGQRTSELRMIDRARPPHHAGHRGGDAHRASSRRTSRKLRGSSTAPRPRTQRLASCLAARTTSPWRCA